MDEATNEDTDEATNEDTNEATNEATNEDTNEDTNDPMNDPMNDPVNDIMNDIMNDNMNDTFKMEQEHDVQALEKRAKDLQRRFDAVVNEVLEDTEQACDTDGDYVLLSGKLRLLFNLNRSIFDTLMEAVREVSIIMSHYKRNYHLMADMNHALKEERVGFDAAHDTAYDAAHDTAHDADEHLQQPPRMRWLSSLFTPLWYVRGVRGRRG